MPKISEYTDTTPILTDEVLGTDDPGGTPTTVTFILSAIKSLFSQTDVTDNDQTGTSYTLVLTDAGKEIRMANASAITMTVPPNSGVAFPTGTVVFLIQTGAGQVTVAEGAGVTINSSGDLLSLRGQWSAAYLKKTDTDEWELVGDIA